MFNWEGLRENKSLTRTPSLPLTAWRTGDFSNLRDASGNLIPIYDPATRVFDAAGNVLQAPTAFPGNSIPAEPHPPGLAEAAQRTTRSRTQERTGANFVNNEARRVNADQFTYRIDFTQSATIELVLPPQHLARARLRSVRDSRTWGSTPTPTCSRWCSATRRTIGSNKLNDLRIGFGQLEERPHLAARQHRERRQGARHQPAQRQSALLGRAEHRRHRALRPRRGERRAVHQRRQDDSVRRQLHVDRRQAFVQVRRRAAARAATTRSAASSRAAGSAFDGRYTQNPLLPAAQRGGAAFADFLLGHFNHSEAQVGAPIANFRSNYFASTSRTAGGSTSNVTVNYGLRWEYDQPFTDTNDAIVNIDFDWANTPRAGLRPRGHRRSLRGEPAVPARARQSSTCATAGSAAAPTSPTTTTSLRGSASRGR